MDEEIESPTDSLEAMVEDDDSDLGDGAITQKCPKDDPTTMRCQS